jgi:hypothetical protein
MRLLRKCSLGAPTRIHCCASTALLNDVISTPNNPLRPVFAHRSVRRQRSVVVVIQATSEPDVWNVHPYTVCGPISRGATLAELTAIFGAPELVRQTNSAAMHFWPWGEAWFIDGHDEVCCVIVLTDKQRCRFDGVRLHGSMKGLAEKFAKLGHHPVDEFIGSITLLPGLTVGTDTKAVGMVRLYLEDFDPYGDPSPKRR